MVIDFSERMRKSFGAVVEDYIVRQNPWVQNIAKKSGSQSEPCDDS